MAPDAYFEASVAVVKKVREVENRFGKEETFQGIEGGLTG